MNSYPHKFRVHDKLHQLPPPLTGFRIGIAHSPGMTISIITLFPSKVSSRPRSGCDAYGHTLTETSWDFHKVAILHEPRYRCFYTVLEIFRCILSYTRLFVFSSRNFLVLIVIRILFLYAPLLILHLPQAAKGIVGVVQHRSVLIYH